MNNSFEDVWTRIMNSQGNTFKTKTGLKFTYEILAGYLITSRTKYKLRKEDFKRAFDLLPLGGPGEINNIVRGPAYVWAILNDTRIIG